MEQSVAEQAKEPSLFTRDLVNYFLMSEQTESGRTITLPKIIGIAGHAMLGYFIGRLALPRYHGTVRGYFTKTFSKGVS